MDRSAHWLDETEEAEFAGLEEQWAVTLDNLVDYS